MLIADDDNADGDEVGAPVHLLPDPPPGQGRTLKPPGGRPRLHPDLPGGTLKHENLVLPKLQVKPSFVRHLGAHEHC